MRYLFIIIVLILLASCQLSVYIEELIDGYALVAQDAYEQMSITHQSSDSSGFTVLINGMVCAVGFNNEHILVKQCKESNISAKNKTYNYFIIPPEDRISKYPPDNFIGPLSYKNYIEKRKQLLVDTNLTFTIFPMDRWLF